MAQAIAAGTSAAPNASTTVRGIAELATNAEARTGTDTTRTVTPRGTREAIDDRVPNATQTTPGKIEISSNAEARGGVNNETAMTPLRVREAIDDAFQPT